MWAYGAMGLRIILEWGRGVDCCGESCCDVDMREPLGGKLCYVKG